MELGHEPVRLDPLRAQGSGSGKVAVQDISITKPLDKSSPNLIKMCCNGTHFKTATLIVRKAGGEKAGRLPQIEMTRGLMLVDQHGRRRWRGQRSRSRSR